MLFYIIYLLLECSSIITGVEVLRPRGVPLSKKSFYDPGKDFQCLDGSAIVPFLLVNDDYCDCDDGSDEPGTNACSNGIFHCSNIGYIEKIIPSSRVNDGICDCCDASDEYNSSANCPSNCLMLGEQMRIEREQYLELLKQGNEKRQAYIEQAKQKIEDTKKELENLKTNLAEAESVKNSKFETKSHVEELEKEALDKHKAREEEIRKQAEEEELKKRKIEEIEISKAAFNLLDKNSDAIITLDEMKLYTKFDRDNDGVVSDEEAKYYTNGLDQLVLPTFQKEVWPLVSSLMQKQNDEAIHSDNASEYVNDNDTNHDTHITDADNNDNEDDLTHEESEELEQESSPSPNQEISSPETEYDPETKQLIEDAKKARDEYNEAEAKFQDIQTKIRELETLLEIDFGPNGEFMPLKEQCFELQDNEYVYKLCPFETATQRSQNGGMETNLGRWGNWVKSEQNYYKQFIMEGGAQCWNGPARSVVVNVGCGAENQLISAAEPNRCQYTFDFKTPAACILNQSGLETEFSHDHTEL